MTRMRSRPFRHMNRSVAAMAVIGGMLSVAQIAGAAGSPIVAGPPVSFPDAIGDSGTAPDISAVMISNDANGQLEFAILVPSHPQPPTNARLFLVLDTDIDRRTGSPETTGGDYYFVLRGADRTFGFYRWDGLDWEYVDTAARVTYASGVFISINRSELGSTDEFSFYAKSRTDGEGSEEGRVDFVPDSSTETYVFPLPIPEPEPVPVPTVTVSKVVTLPSGAPRAGKPYGIQVSVLLDIDGEKTPVPPTRLSCSAKVGAAVVKTRVKPSGSLAKFCSFVVPATARGKSLVVRLRGVVTVTVEGGVPFSESFTKTVKSRVK